MTAEKPPYRIPALAEILAGRGSRGYRAASTFSGCGGACLGLEWAGWDVAWANEFVQAARDTYRENHPGVILDGRDIREVTGAEILDQLDLEVGELDLLEGSPPCAAFSTAGKREAGWGDVKKYSDTEQRVDDLFFEYVRLAREMRPRLLLAENVPGLRVGTAKGYLKIILAAMREAGYRVKAAELDAQWLGVPQRRRRLIFVGVRDDLAADPVFPTPLTYRYSLAEAVASPVVMGGKITDYSTVATSDPDDPTPPASVGGFGGAERGEAVLVPASYLTQRGPQDGFAGDPLVMFDENGDPRDPETGANLSLRRYAIYKEWKKIAPGAKSGKYLNLIRSHDEHPIPTVTAKGGDVSAASVTHSTEPRKFTLAELRRVCGFPDDFTLTGTYGQRWERLGRAVPPPMYFHVGTVLADLLDRIGDQP